MPWVWGLADACVGWSLSPGKFQSMFTNEESMNLVLHCGPWSSLVWMLTFHRWYPNINEEERKIIPFWVGLSGILTLYFTNALFRLVISRIDPVTKDGMLLVHRWFPDITDDDMHIVTFWVQISGITLLYLSKVMARFVGDQLGPVTEVDFDEDANMVEFIRVQISWNVDWPLRFRKHFQFVPDDNTLRTYRFERFRHFCTNCGSLTHEVKERGLSFDNGNNDDSDLSDDDDPSDDDGDISVGMAETDTLHTIELFGAISGFGRGQEWVKSRKDKGWSMRRWPAVKSFNWPFTFLDWVLVYLSTQVLSWEVPYVFKTSIWKIQQRRLPDDHSESMPTSSILLISPKRQDTALFSTTSISHFKSKVMPKAFWSLSYKLLANIKYVKEGHNRLFHLLAWQRSARIAWLLSTLSSKLFQFPIFAYNGCIVLVLYFINSF